MNKTESTKPSEMQYDNALHMMEVQGGSFVRALAACYYAADTDNKLRLRSAFADYFGSYELRFLQYVAAKESQA